MSMRRLCLILLCGLVAVPAALAAVSAPGDGVLELSKVNGSVVVTGTRGTLWGQIDKGRLVVSDPIVGDGQVLVSGAETKRAGVLEGTTVYSGTDIRFRVTGGRYRLSLKGSGIDLTAVGVGTAQLARRPTRRDPGELRARQRQVDSRAVLPGIAARPVRRPASDGRQPVSEPVA